MKNSIRWLTENTLIATAMVVAAAISAAVFQASEISSRDYQILAGVYPGAPAQLKQHIQTSLQDGSITRWDYVLIFKKAMDARRVVGWTDDEGSTEVHRAKLQRIIADDMASG